MTAQPLRYLSLVWLAVLAAGTLAAQTTLDTIGVTRLRLEDATLNGSGIRVAQPEATGGTAWEVNPAATGQPVGLFTYTSAAGTATGFPNTVGTESGHADSVGDNFYGKNNTANPEGVAYGVSAVDCYEANYFYNSLVATGTSISARVANFSFVFQGAENSAVDQVFDTYLAQYGTKVFVCGIGNSGPPLSPATCYNSIGVAAYGGSSSVGPTVSGRSKPDITAPAGATSFSTPLVSGAAALLVQRALRGDVGPVADAGDARTIKALLLNGAVKPSDWTTTGGEPLDRRYGTGVLNVWNSYRQLIGGNHAPGNLSNSAIAGWNRTTISGNPLAVHHYYFTLRPSRGSTFDLTATLVWNRDLNETTIKNLDLVLYNRPSNTPVPGGGSVSTVNNVEHLSIASLPAGSYDLQVIKAATSVISPDQTYSLAFNFTPLDPAVKVISIQPGPTGTQITFNSPGGITYQLQAKDNIGDAAQPWTVVASGTTDASGTTTPSDPSAAGLARRFYRVVFTVP